MLTVLQSFSTVSYSTFGAYTNSLSLFRSKKTITMLVTDPKEAKNPKAPCCCVVGRQCMASCFFLLQQFEDVLIYLKSIKEYLASDDDFNWNYGIACASNGEWAEAEEAFGAVQGVGYRQEGAFLNWSARTFIKQGEQGR